MTKILRGRTTRAVVILLLTLSAAHTFYPQSFNKSAEVIQMNQPGLYKVIHFKDGDTIVVNMQGTPETHKPNTPVQCYGPAASAHTKILIGNSKVRLESDPLSTDRDRYNRLLPYVFLPDGRLVNEDLIRNGYGFYYPYFCLPKVSSFPSCRARLKHYIKACGVIVIQPGRVLATNLTAPVNRRMSLGSLAAETGS